MKKIVVIGGANGTGLSIRGLKNEKNVQLSAVVSMSDSGRTSGKIRKELGQLPPADIMRVILAGSDFDYYTLKKIFYSRRFKGDKKIDGLNIGSLLFALTSQYTGNIIDVVKNFSTVLDCKTKVYPATLDMTTLCAELNSGKEICGEGAIDEPGEDVDSNDLVKRVWLEPSGKGYRPALMAIAEADMIITGPGDLYTSNVAATLAEGIYEAIAKSSAKLVYVAGNKYTIGGEPSPIGLSCRVKALEEYLPRPVDHIIYNNHKISGIEKKLYNEQNWGQLNYDADAKADSRVMSVDLERKGGGISPKKLAKAILKCF